MICLKFNRILLISGYCAVAKKMIHHNFYQLKLERDANLSLALHTPKGTKTFALEFELISKKILTQFSGRGVFATSDIQAGTIIDMCPVLVFEPDENENHIRHTSLHHYT